MTSVLVLGSTGRLGHLLRLHWPEQSKHEMRWHGRNPPTDPAFDILRDPTALREAIQRADIVLVLAGSTPASGSDLGSNIAIAQRVFDANDDTPILFASTAAVYGRGPSIETCSVEPVSDYGRVKRRAEEIVQGHPAQSCILRIGNVIGADALLRDHRAERRLHVFTDGTSPRRSYISPLQLAEVLETLITKLANGIELPDIVNIACPQPVFMANLLDAAGLNWTPVPAPPEVIKSVVLDTGRLEALFPFAPDASLPKTLLRGWSP